MKKVLAIALALALVLALSCAAFADGDKLGYTCMDGTNPFFVALEGAIREVVEAHGDTLISLDPQNSNEKQLSQVEDLISQGIKVLFVNPVDRDGIIAALDKVVPITTTLVMSAVLTSLRSALKAVKSSFWTAPRCSLLLTVPTASSMF